MRRRWTPTVLERYADLIVSVGANVQPDQVLAVEALPEAQPLVAAIARRAYEKGARYVDVVYFDPAVKRIRIESAPDDSLEWVPPWLGQRMLGLGDLDAARVVLVPLVPPGLLDGLDPVRAGPRPAADGRRAEQGDRRPLDRVDALALPHALVGAGRLSGARRRRRRSSGSGTTSPTSAAWTSPIRAPPGTSGSSRSGRWPAASTRSASTALRFEGPGTDLTVGLLPSSRFAKEGGSSRTRTGIRHIPNIPTEEVYTTPDPERTEGFVTATKPLDMFGSLVTGLRVRFEGGRAVEIDADANVEALRGQCSCDPGGVRLGEVALVDGESRIGKLGRTFFTTLLDENAACHIAFGDAYASPIADPADLPRINTSAIHVDFMIGSNDVDVTGVTKSRREVPHLRGGVWQI